MTISLRPDRALFRFSGPDAQKLLNDVLTTRVEAEPGPAHWWALLSPQGKVQAEGLIGWADGAFWVDVHQSVADAFFKRMKMYRLRADVTMDDLRATHRVGWFVRPLRDGLIEHADARGEKLGVRLIATADQAKAWDDAADDFAAAKVAAGVSELGPDFAADQVFPHDIGMDFLGGVDFKKGCYVGQEVVSRVHHRGTARRRILPAEFAGQAPAPGTPVLAGETEVGVLCSTAGAHALASIRLDRAQDASAAGTPLSAGGIALTLGALPSRAPQG